QPNSYLVPAEFGLDAGLPLKLLEGAGQVLERPPVLLIGAHYRLIHAFTTLTSKRTVPAGGGPGPREGQLGAIRATPALRRPKFRRPACQTRLRRAPWRRSGRRNGRRAECCG